MCLESNGTLHSAAIACCADNCGYAGARPYAWLAPCTTVWAVCGRGWLQALLSYSFCFVAVWPLA